MLNCFFQSTWRWLYSNDNLIKKDDRQHLMGEFKDLVYAKSREQFDDKLEAMRCSQECLKYPQFLRYLDQCYGNRPNAWATYSRIERQLPTHGSNTTAYAEVSMKLTKETVFGRQKARNLPEMLNIICDNSDPYKNKLIEVGNNRSSVLRKARSKYAGPESKVTKEQIVDLGNGGYLVQSLKYEDLWYTANMKTGACTCAKGINCAPCHHKSAISKHFNTAEFSVVPTHDPCQQAMYHFIATGTTLKAHMYRKREDDQSIPEIEKYISEKLMMRKVPEVNIEVEMDTNDDLEMHGEPPEFEVDDVVEQDEDGEAQNVRDFFLKALQEYGEKVVSMNDTNSIKAMKAMTKTLRKSMKCNPHTIQQQLHTFGKGGAASRKSKWGRVIKPNPPAIAARLAPGSGPAPLGRHFKDRRGQVVKHIAILDLFLFHFSLFIKVHTQVAHLPGGEVIISGKRPVYQKRRPHNLKLAIDDNVRSAR